MIRAPVVMVGLQGSPADEWLIRYAANLAGLSDARLQAEHVRALDNLDPATERLAKDRRLLGKLGGILLEVRSGDPASGLIEAAHDAGACQLVIGSRHRWRLSRLLNGSTVTDQVLCAVGDLPVQVVNVGRPDKTSREWRRQHISPGGTQEEPAACRSGRPSTHDRLTRIGRDRKRDSGPSLATHRHGHRAARVCELHVRTMGVATAVR